MTSSRLQGIAIAWLAIIVLAFGPVGNTKADVILGNSTAYGESISVTFTPSPTFAPFVPPVTLTSGPFPTAFGVAPAPYSVSNQALAVTIPLPAGTPVPLLTLEAAAFPVNASSNVNGLPGVRNAHADAAAGSLALNFGLFLPATPISPAISITLMTLGVNQIVSSADVTGDFPTLIPTGSTDLARFILDFPFLPGVGPFTYPLLSPAPNTELIPAPLTGFLSVLLDEVTFAGNGVTFQSVDVNAVHISFTGIPVPSPIPFVNLGTVTGDIIVAHSDALLVAVPTPTPEPGTFVLTAIGSMLLGLWRGRRLLRFRHPPGEPRVAPEGGSPGGDSAMSRTE
jgi:hypothetical protein